MLVEIKKKDRQPIANILQGILDRASSAASGYPVYGQTAIKVGYMEASIQQLIKDVNNGVLCDLV